jgi:hypothetical protein
VKSGPAEFWIAAVMLAGLAVLRFAVFLKLRRTAYERRLRLLLLVRPWPFAAAAALLVVAALIDSKIPVAVAGVVLVAGGIASHLIARGLSRPYKLR